MVHLHALTLLTTQLLKQELVPGFCVSSLLWFKLWDLRASVQENHEIWKKPWSQNLTPLFLACNKHHSAASCKLPIILLSYPKEQGSATHYGCVCLLAKTTTEQQPEKQTWRYKTLQVSMSFTTAFFNLLLQRFQEAAVACNRGTGKHDPFGAWKRGKEENVLWLHCIFKWVVINTSSRSAREIPHSGSGRLSQEFGKDSGLLLISYSHSQAATIVHKSCSLLLTSAFLRKAWSLEVSQCQKLTEFIHKTTGIWFRYFHSRNSSYIQLPAELCLLLLSDYSSLTFFS